MDVAAATRQYLLAQAEISDLVSDRIFIGGLRADQAVSMPRKAIVLNHSGGTAFGGGVGGGDLTELIEQRIDFFCYGETAVEAAKVRTAVFGAMKRMIRQVFSGVLLHRALESGGAVSLKDPDGGWPLFMQAWSVLGATTVPVNS